MKLSHVRSTMITAAVLWVTPLAAQPSDPFLWLEEVEGERALQWVQAQNAATIAALTVSRRTSRSCSGHCSC
jgi:prolyl oligopeptidase